MTYDALTPGQRRSLVRALEGAIRSVDNRVHIQNDPIGDSPTVRARPIGDSPTVRARRDAPTDYNDGWATLVDGEWAVDLETYLRAAPLRRA